MWRAPGSRRGRRRPTLARPMHEISHPRRRVAALLTAALGTALATLAPVAYPVMSDDPEITNKYPVYDQRFPGSKLEYPTDAVLPSAAPIRLPGGGGVTDAGNATYTLPLKVPDGPAGM